MFLMVSQVEKQMIRTNQGTSPCHPKTRLFPPSWEGTAFLRGLVGKELLDEGLSWTATAPHQHRAASGHTQRLLWTHIAGSAPSQLSQDAALENDWLPQATYLHCLRCENTASELHGIMCICVSGWRRKRGGLLAAIWCCSNCTVTKLPMEITCLPRYAPTHGFNPQN